MKRQARIYANQLPSLLLALKLVPPMDSVLRIHDRMTHWIGKIPRVCSIRIGDTWCHLFAKLIIKCYSEEVTVSCGSLQLCARLKVIIEDNIHLSTCI